MILCTGMALMVSESAADSLVVVEVYNTDQFTIGGIVDSGQTISLGKDAEIALVSQAGQKIAVTGPYRGSIGGKIAGGKPSEPARRGGDIVALLSKALARDSRRAKSLSLAAMRFVKLEPEDMWVIDLSQGGAHCLPAGRMPVLWHPEGSRAGLAWLHRQGGKARGRIVWESGRETTPWPPGVEAKTGGTYIAGRDGGREQKFTLHFVPADLPTPAHRAAWMAGQGCQIQALRLLTGSAPDHRLGAAAR